MIISYKQPGDIIKKIISWNACRCRRRRIMDDNRKKTLIVVDMQNVSLMGLSEQRRLLPSWRM